MIFNAFKLVCEALSNGMCGRWLLVLDNLDDMKMLGRMVGLPWEMGIEEATKPPPKAYLPRSPKGLTLITTRSDSVGNSLTGMRITKIGPMDESDALSLLRSCLAPDAMSDLNDCLELVKALDYVPLAIKQAAAFLRHTGVSLGLYLNRFRNIHGEMSSLTEEEEKDSRGDFESRCSIFRTLKISFDWISQTRPRAAEIFRLMAALDRQGIPKRLLKRNTEREADFNKWLGGLKDFSLISATKGEDDLVMHRLVQLAVRSWTRSDRELSRYQDEALEIMAREFPHETCDNEALCQALIPQAWVVVQYKTSEMTRPRTRLLQNVGIYMMRISLYNVAFDALSEALRLQSNFVDLDKNTEALVCRFYIAETLFELGKHTEAEELHRKVLECRRALLGQDHEDTIKSMTHIGLQLLRRGKFEEARDICEQAVEKQIKTLGCYHGDTERTLVLLGEAMTEHGKYDGRIFNIYGRKFGYNRPVKGEPRVMIEYLRYHLW